MEESAAEGGGATLHSRITRILRAEGGAFNGEGARGFGGRWNSKGTSIVYAAGSQALAALEILVHIGSSCILAHYVVIPVQFDDSLITGIAIEDLPKNWKVDPAPASLRTIGDGWIRRGESAVLRVPSAVIAAEYYYLLNPVHPDFAKVEIGEPTSFRFDPCLRRGR